MSQNSNSNYPVPASRQASGADHSLAPVSVISASSLPLSNGMDLTPPRNGPPALSSSPTVSGLLHSLRRCWLWAVLAAAIGGAGTVAAIVFMIPGQYSASALIQVTPPPRSDTLGEQYIDVKTYRDNQAAIIRSTSILNEALKLPEVREFPEVQEKVNPAVWLQGQIKVDFTEGPAIMRISMSGKDPHKLKALINAVATTYDLVSKRREKQRRQVVLDELNNTLRNTKETIRAKTGLLHDYRNKNNIPSPEESKSRIDSLLRERAATNRQLTDLRLNEKRLQSQLTYLKKRDLDLEKNPLSQLAVENYLKGDVQIAAFFTLIAKEDAQIEELRKRIRSKQLFEQFAGKHIRNKEKYLGQLDEYRRSKEPVVRRQMRQEMQISIDKLKQELSGLDEQKKLIREEIDRVSTELSKIRSRPLMKEEVTLQADIKAAHTALEGIEKRIAHQRLIISAGINIVVQQLAELPTSVDRSRQIKYGGAAGLAVFSMLLLGVALLEFRSRKINTAEDVANGLGMKVVGTLPLLPARFRNLKTDNPSQRDLYWQDIMTESIDSVRTMLLHAARAEDLQVVMVTSAMGGEGKTSVASQLAASLARAWKKTLLIDGDLRNPAIHRLLNQPEEPGLSELLRGDVEAADAIYPTQLSRLWVMPGGKWDSHALQALAQDGVRTMFGQLKEEYDFIIVDSCPVLPVADSLSLAQHVDAVVFSVLRDVSRAPSVHAAQQRLANLDIRMLGAVMIGQTMKTGRYK